MGLMADWKRSSYCAQVTAENAGQKYIFMGWVQRRRDLGGLIFVWLRDRTGIVQVVFDQSVYPQLFEQAQQLRSEYVIAVKGEIRLRTQENINPELKTGEIEVIATELKILSTADLPPFAVDDEVQANDNLRLKYRYLDLRRPYMINTFIKRHQITKSIREFFDANGFIDVETPVLTKSTPEGARDYLVPSRVHKGKFFALPQSPQLMKQLLMVSGFDRYYQITKCFRDEDLRADRQPEFTQVDFEMSFVDMEDVFSIAQGMLEKLWKDTLDYPLAVPFPRMTYDYAMNYYGSDKPDTRFGLEFFDLVEFGKKCDFGIFSNPAQNGGCVKALLVKDGASKFSRKEIDALVDHAKYYKAKGMAWHALDGERTRSSFAKNLPQPQMDELIAITGMQQGDILFIIADMNKYLGMNALGQVRLQIGKKLNLIDESKFNFLFITDFPMFEKDEETGRYVATHHAFTMPMEQDIPLLDTDPLAVRAQAYDVVLNGYELSSGSIRIHDRDIQNKIFNIMGFDDQQAYERFGFLLDAFKYGAPPHGGMAFGLDRLTMLITGRTNIRDVVVFPKLQNAACPLTESPSEVDLQQLDDLGIMVKAKDE